MTPDSRLLLLESPERLIRRLAADLARRDREEWNAKVKAEKKWRAKNKDRARWHNFNSNRRARGKPTLPFEEYLATAKGKRGQDKQDGAPREARGWGISKLSYHQHNYLRRKKGLPGIAYETFVEERMARNLGTPVNKETVAAREARYQRLRERLKNEPRSNESSASKLGILTPTQIKQNTMETDSAQQHLLDKMTRQEGGSPLVRRGFFTLFNGGYWATKRRGS